MTLTLLIQSNLVTFQSDTQSNFLCPPNLYPWRTPWMYEFRSGNKSKDLCFNEHWGYMLIVEVVWGLWPYCGATSASISFARQTYSSSRGGRSLIFWRTSMRLLKSFVPTSRRISTRDSWIRDSGLWKNSSTIRISLGHWRRAINAPWFS